MITKYLDIISQAPVALHEGSIIAFAALFLMLALGELGVPFPLLFQGVLFFIGFQIVHGGLPIIPLVLVLITGRLFGSAIAYWLSRFLGNPFVKWLKKRFPRLSVKIDRAKQRLSMPAPLAVAAGRLTGLLVPTSLASGAIGLRYEYFVMGIVLSAVIWDATFITAGAIFGSAAQHLAPAISPWLLLGSSAIIFCLAWAAARLLIKRKPHYEET